MQGQIQAVYPVTEGFHFSCFDTLPAQEGHPAALVALASMLADESQNSGPRFYTLATLKGNDSMAEDTSTLAVFYKG